MAAPVSGWNDRDPLDGMEPTDAVRLDNWYADAGKVSVRPGSAVHGTGVGSGAVETIAEFDNGSTRKMLAAGGGAVYDATTAGAASSLATGFSSNRWQDHFFAGKLGLVNGTDAPQDYDGTTFGAMTISGGGLTVTDLIGVTSYKTARISGRKRGAPTRPRSGTAPSTRWAVR